MKPHSKSEGALPGLQGDGGGEREGVAGPRESLLDKQLTEVHWNGITMVSDTIFL